MFYYNKGKRKNRSVEGGPDLALGIESESGVRWLTEICNGDRSHLKVNRRHFAPLGNKFVGALKLYVQLVLNANLSNMYTLALSFQKSRL